MRSALILFYCSQLFFSIALASSINVRVLMADISLQDSIDVWFEPQQTSTEKMSQLWYVATSCRQDSAFCGFNESRIVFHNSINGIRLNGHRINSQAVYLQCPSQHWKAHWQGNTTELEGSILLVKNDDRLLIISVVDLEEYVAGVIRWESWPGWPLEMNKVCAILARTYAVHHIIQARKTKKAQNRPSVWYDVKGTNIHQTYKGRHRLGSLQEAVLQTRGRIIAYKNKPIIAMYDACCGGVVPRDIVGFDFGQAPYLSRDYACTFCKDCKAYRWRLHYSIAAFNALLESHFKEAVAWSKINGVTHSDAGQLLVLDVDVNGKQEFITGKQLYAIFKDVKSFCYSLAKKGNGIVFEGKGLGHHIGLCQWGARSMIKRGYTVAEIIAFFYPGTQIMRIKDFVLPD